MEEVIYQKKKQQNQQLIILFRKLEELEESCWTKLLRFQKSEYFVTFEKRYSVPNVISLRLDDFIYLLLLLLEELIFGLLPIDGSNVFSTVYRQSLALFYLTTFIVIISPHWFRWLSLIAFCIAYPALLYLTFNGYISMMPVDPSTLVYSYLGYLSLGFIFVLLLLIYPIKEYIRNTAGSLYSYIYGLSMTLILYLWPLYSFIQSNGSFSFTFITSNQPLIITFIVMAVTGFYFFIHHSLFQIKISKVKELLLEDFTEGQLVQALEETQEEHQQITSCLHTNFNVYVRSMSFIIYALTIGCEIYLYIALTNDSSKMSTIGPLMGYILAFLLLGAFFMFIPLSKEVLIPFLAIISICSALPSLSYYNTSTNFINYAIISLSFPFFALFWSLVKIISPKKPFLRTNMIIGLYIIIYLPVSAFAMNSYSIFTSDTSLMKILNYVFLSVIGVSFLVLLIAFIAWQISKKRKDEPKEEQKQRVPVDYNYFEQGNPVYEHYEINKLVNVTYISNVDLRDPGYIICLIFFLISELMAIHAVNELKTTFANTTFYSSIINQVIYAQIYIVFIFYIYSHCYLASTSELVPYFFIPYFVLTAILFIFFGLYFTSISSTLKIIGGFSLVMALVVFALQAIKSFAKSIIGFISTIIVTVLWLFIVFPYAVLIPFSSIYVNQSAFGTFIYGCILATVVLIIFMVGVLTLIFNRLIDKYQQEKKFKFMTEDVVTLLEEQGVETQDSQLNVLYESFLYRDKKYVFFLKKGYPVNLLKDPDDEITKLVTSQDYGLKRIPTKKQISSQRERNSSCIWICLTCCCGEDDDEIVEKIKKAKKHLDKQELQSLLPKSLMSGLIKSDIDSKKIKQAKKIWANPTKVFSSKSLILKDMHSGPRYLGDQYILLKTDKKADLAVQIWHQIFDFAANGDEGQSLIICNDFAYLLEAGGINQITKTQMDEIFHKFAHKKWRDHSGMDLQDFSSAIENVSQLTYNESQVDIPEEQRKFYLLIDKIYYNLSSFEEFNNFNFEKKKSKGMSKQALKKSPFRDSYRRYKEFLIENNKEKLEMMQKLKNHDRDKFMEPKKMKDNEFLKKEEQKEEVKTKSCKKILYEKVKACQQCCKKEESRDQIEKRLFVKPWNPLAVDCVKILERKQIEWSSSSETNKQHPFRLVSNNILMAAFKLIDIFTYVSISIMNPQLNWLSSYSTSSNLYIDYSIQTYLAAAIVLISVPLSIRGVMLIFEDRLGLTQNRLPAAFPHPMFFFTFIYKLMILSLFNIISQTFLDTFNCNWTNGTNNVYTLNDDPTIQCFSVVHNRFILLALAGILIYYPLSSYAMPNFQFAEKSLDLKFRSSYLILYFQVNFALLSGKVLLSSSTNTIVQIVYNGINIFALSLLGFSVVSLQPCLIAWFNYVQLLVVGIGIIVNVMGLVLYMTGQWLLCVITVGTGCCAFILFIIIFVRRKFFSKQIHAVEDEEDENVQELEMMWYAKQKAGKKIIEFEGKNRAGTRLEAIKNDDGSQNSDEKTDENLKLKK